MNKKELIDLVIEAIKTDLDNGDVTALEVLLEENVSTSDLLAFLPNGGQNE